MSILSISSPGLNYNSETLQLQKDLAALGFAINADGQFGPITEQTIKDFQSYASLSVTGVADLETQAALKSMLGESPPQWITEWVIGQPETVPIWIQQWVAGYKPAGISLAGVDWKWIILGVVVAIMIFGMMKGKR